MTSKLASANVQSAKRASLRTGSASFVGRVVTIDGDAYAKMQADAIRRDVLALRPVAFK